jgi:hypothetical protein
VRRETFSKLSQAYFQKTAKASVVVVSRSPNAGLVVTPSASSLAHIAQIVTRNSEILPSEGLASR